MAVRRATFMLVLCLLGAVACSSSPERSTASFCNTFHDEAIRLHDKYQRQANSVDMDKRPLQGLLVAFGTLLQAQGDLVVLMDRLDKVAPDEIEPDVGAMRDAFKKQAEATQDAPSNPLAALGSGLISGLQSMGSSQQVESYLTDHCDLSFERSQ